MHPDPDREVNSVDYDLLAAQTEALVGGCRHSVANLANVSALIYQEMDRINWAGFYLMKTGVLVLGPFQGKPACIEIPEGKGVCGTAAAEDRPQRVDDVHRFPGHIACDDASRSELVIPLHGGGRVIGVLDIDSPEYARFSQEDEDGLLRLCQVLERHLAACD